jgi:hypothetical protein
MTITELIAYVKELEKENTRLEELYQEVSRSNSSNGLCEVQRQSIH